MRRAIACFPTGMWRHALMDRIHPMLAFRYNVFRMLIKYMLSYAFLILWESNLPTLGRGVATKRYSEAPRALLKFSREASCYVEGRELAQKL